jgi:hypothetical protein
MLLLSYAFAILLAIAPAANAEEITVRVISVKTGHPLAERRIQLFVDYLLHPPDTYPEFVFSHWAFTDGSGLAKFHVPGSLPARASVFVGGLIDYCSPATYRAEQVQQGVAIANLKGCSHRPLKKFLVKPNPGEIVIYSPEYSGWERMLYFPWPE